MSPRSPQHTACPLSEESACSDCLYRKHPLEAHLDDGQTETSMWALFLNVGHTEFLPVFY